MIFILNLCYLIIRITKIIIFMKRTLLLSALLIFTSLFSFAQKGNRAYAITGQANGNFSWTDIREIDLSTGKVVNTIFENAKTKFTITDPTGKNLASNLKNIVASPTSTMVAAAAYDSRHDKLFFIPMRNGELRWLDLNSRNSDLKFSTAQSAILSSVNQLDEANNFTRMTIGADGNGYAITNDANHLIRFTTGKKTVITDLGNIVDASSANGVSVHNKCSSWGGDIVADTYGKLYLFTASNTLFTIDIESRIATYVGSIKNLAPSFTINGAAVDNDDNVIVGSANNFDGFYKINVKDLTAEKLNTSGQVFNASDLANSNLLYQSRNKIGSAELVQREIIGNEAVSIYPNPVSGSQFKITFDNTRPGEYNIALTDLQGRLIQTKQVNIKYSSQVETMQMKTKPAGGMYMIKITDSNKKSLFSDKIVID
jgi:Secretion system C-terminal sorting domain